MAINNETIGIADLKMPEEGPLQVGTRKQLFIDNRFIEVSENISLVMNPPVKVNEPVFGSDKPWEAFRLAFFNVFRDEGLFKMWYSAFDNDQWKGAERMHVCYATSEDGIHWERPELGLVEYKGSKANNIVAAPWRRLIQFVFIDEHGPPEQRYKMILCRIIGTEDERGIYVITSPDGLHWTEPGERLRPMTWDTQKMGYWDEELGKYVVFERVMGKRGRAIGRLEMEDITAPWPMPTPLVLESDEQDPPDSDLYTSVIYKYPYAEDAYFAFPMTYQHFAPDQSPVKNDGTCDVQMAVSRDGRNWSRPDRRPYVERGLPGEIDCGITCLTSTVRVLNELWHYGVPWPYTHGGFRRLSDEERAKSWGRAFLIRYIQHLDGFMSADATYMGGYLITPPLIFEGNRLEINVNSSAMGSVRVEILGENGRVIPGFSADESEKISFNSLAYIVKWRGESDVSELAGKPIWLKFVMRGAKLYAFQFTF